MKNKIQALANFLEVSINEIVNIYDNTFECNNEEYLVLTDSEADEAEDDYLEQYIDDCVLFELPEQYRNYFDRESFKYDCRFDGRGHSLASYDGNENEEGEFYIYRVN